MTTKLVRWSWVLALPVSAVLAAPRERAVEVPLNSTEKIAARSTTTTKSGSTATHKATASRHKGKTAARQTTTVKERHLSMRDTAPAGPDADGVYHSIRDWVPRTPTKASLTEEEPERSSRASRKERPAAREQAEELNR